MQRLLLILFSAVLFMGITHEVKAQLPPGSTAPDWTLTDLDGNSHHLYSMLDEGKTVFIELSATWCGPCWNYHNSGAFNNLWTQYGPNGTDEVRVFFIEADLSTNEACLYGPSGCVGGTQGDWVTGTLFPIINLTSTNGPTIPAQYQLGYYPTIYAICPNRKVYEAGQRQTAGLAEYINSCPFDLESIVGSEIDCYESADGTIELEYFAGTQPVSFKWSNGATTQNLENLTPGVYTVTATEKNQMKFTASVEVLGPDPFVAELENKGDINCFGQGDGFIEISASGGTSGYSYQWNTGATGSAIYNLSGGTYTVTVTDAKGCTDVFSQTIHEPALLESYAVAEIATCDEDNGVIEVTTIGGTEPYTYDLGFGPQGSPVFTNLASGFYTVTITDDNGCVNFETLEIEEFPAPVIVIDAEEYDLPCNGDNLFIDASQSMTNPDCFFQWVTVGGNIVSGEYSLIVEVNAPGTYTLYISDMERDCYREETVRVYEATGIPVAHAGAEKMLTCGEDEVTLDGSQSSQGNEFRYLWTTTNGHIVSGENTLTPIVSAAGDYMLKVTNVLEDCVATSTTTVVADQNLPDVSVSKDGDLDCEASAVTLSGEGSETGSDINVKWTNSAGETLGTGYTLDVTSAGVYTFTVLNTETGCEASQSVEVFVSVDAPAIELQTPEIITCENPQVEITSDGSSSGSDYSYTWTTTDGSIVGGNSGQSITVDAAGTYVLTINNTSNGCSSSASVTVDEDLNLPVAAYSEIADNLTVNFTSESSGNPSAYLWEFGDGNTSTDANPTHTYASDNTYEVCLTITNECGTDRTCKYLSVSISNIGVGGTVGHVLCYGDYSGTIELQVEAGDLDDYTFEWDDGETGAVREGLSAGTYTVTVTGPGGAQETKTYTIYEPDALAVSTEVVDVLCHGELDGYVKVNVAGGVEPYSYNWSNDLENNSADNLDIGAGLYSVTITDANGCVYIIEEIEIDQPEKLSVEADVVDVLCHGDIDGEITISVGGGVLPYEYEWSNGWTESDLHGLPAGKYSLTVTDANNCTVVYNNIEVVQPGNIELLADITDVKCYGDATGEILAQIEGGVAPFAFEWNNGSADERISDLTAGEYSLTVTDDNSCVKTFNNIEVKEPTEIVLDDVSMNEETDNNSISIAVSGGVEPYTYKWNNGANTSELTGLPDGKYSVVVTDANGCIVEFGPFQLGETTRTMDIEGLQTFRLFPNPANDIIRIDIDLNYSAEMTVEIINSLGQTMHRDNFIGNTIKSSIDVSSYSSGIYFLKLSTDKGVSTKSFIISK